MKRKISLKWFLALSFIALSILLIIGYSFLSIRFFFRGMDNMIADNMAHALNSYIHITTVEQRQHMNRFSGYLISREWRQMPEEILKLTETPPSVGQLKVGKKEEWFAPPEKVVFAMQLLYEEEKFYITQIATRQTASPLMGRNREKILSLLIAISLLTVLGLFVVIWLLLRQVERPVKALGSWAHELTPKNLQAPPPDFFYPELNELTRLIQTSLLSVQEALDREHRFLRHSSHELRTPISVIRNNLELWQKLRETAEKNRGTIPGDTSQKALQQEKIIDRIDRASLTMMHLTETLLWLSRDTDTHLAVEEVDLEQLVTELAHEAGYLLKDKDVEVVLDTSPATVKIPGAPARIVAGNLIRNAFQHTWHGTVRIVQAGNHVEIINDALEQIENDQDLGFGLGLQLTRQLCEKLNWHYTSQMESGQYRAAIVFNFTDKPS